MNFKMFFKGKTERMINDLMFRTVLMEVYAKNPMQKVRARQAAETVRSMRKIHRFINWGCLSTMIGLLGMMVFDQVTDKEDRPPVGLVVYPTMMVVMSGVGLAQDKRNAKVKQLQQLIESYNRAQDAAAPDAENMQQHTR